MSRPSGLPARPAWYVGRAGVSALLDRSAWLTTLVAGAGASKTTAVGGWAATRPAVWVTLGVDDAEFPVFVGKLRDAAIAAGVLAQPVVETLRVATGTVNNNEYADSLASLVAAAATHGSRPADQAPAIVLDGFNLIPARSPTVRFVEALTRHAPSGIRMIICSRLPMPFPIDRLRDTGRICELANDDLVFDVDEAYQLLTIALGDAADADEIAGDLHTLSAGWPSQISLGAAWLGQQPPAARRSHLPALDGFDGELNEAVLKSAPPMVRSLVRLAAHLPRVNAPLLAEVGGYSDGEVDDRLPTCAPMLMPESGRPGWHRISPAARSAVLAVDPMPGTDRRAAQRAAVSWFSRHGELDSAVATCIDLADPGVAADLLERHGADLISAGRTADVLAAVEVIPVSSRTAGMLLVEGEARFARGDVPGAIDCIRTVVPPDGEVSASLARRVGKLRQLAGDIAGAAEVYRRVRQDGRQPVDEAIMLGQLATVHWLRGDLEGARPAAKAAMAGAEKCGDARALANAYAAAAMVAERDADLDASEEYARRAASAAEACGDLMQLTRVRINRSQRLVLEGRYGQALVELDTALRLTELTGSGGWFGAVTRTNRGWAFRGLGRHDEALAEIGVAYEFWDAAHSDLVAYAQIARGAVLLDRGELERADSELSAAMVIGERSGDHQALNGITSHARVRYATDPDGAWELVERAREINIGHWLHWVPLTKGWLALCDNDRRAAIAYVGEALESMRRYRDAFAMAEATELRALADEDGSAATELLLDAGRQWARLGNPVFVNRVGVALAHRTGRGVAAAEARLLAVGVRPSVALAAGPLRVVGAFQGGSGVGDQARFVTAAHNALALVEVGDPAARQALVDAVALLPEVSARNDEVRAHHVRVLRALATMCETSGEIEAALAWHLRVLEDDPYDEVSHLGVVTTLASAGRHSEARRRYRMYTERMRQSDREPAPYPA